ncbi:YheU family protein [Alginatibacterium sediminis]|uniref:YheU family protein n=1 Tax=Alginatibacterium sediminis TaxID=2164068 RepID=A0A420EKU9_9ALTE|nr:YheU family protein [Alginatibacterium sediminis]RKF21317.1 YheU family protein [Alginatibacterium sediminis]
MIIPWRELEAETLHNLLESIVLREGTDYGELELSLEQKLSRLRQQLESEQIVLMYSETHESVNAVAKDQVNFANNASN